MIRTRDPLTVRSDIRQHTAQIAEGERLGISELPPVEPRVQPVLRRPLSAGLTPVLFGLSELLPDV